jgi:hypothetical protein
MEMFSDQFLDTLATAVAEKVIAQMCQRLLEMSPCFVH